MDIMIKKIVIICIFLTAGCSDKSVEPPKIDTSVIMPLAENNLWQYSVSYINANGFHDSIKQASIIITHDTTIDSQHWYAAASNTRLLFYQNRSDGLWIKENSDSAYLIYKYPAIQGESYQAGNNSITVIAQYQPIFAYAGDFKCYAYSVIENIPLADSMVYYVAPGYGLIDMVVLKWENSTYRVAEGWSLTYARFN